MLGSDVSSAAPTLLPSIAAQASEPGGRMDPRERPRLITDTVDEPDADSAVTFSGRDPILPTSFLVGALGAATTAAAALAAVVSTRAHLVAALEGRVARRCTSFGTFLRDRDSTAEAY